MSENINIRAMQELLRLAEKAKNPDVIRTLLESAAVHARIAEEGEVAGSERIVRDIDGIISDLVEAREEVELAKIRMKTSALHKLARGLKDA